MSACWNGTRPDGCALVDANQRDQFRLPTYMGVGGQAYPRSGVIVNSNGEMQHGRVPFVGFPIGAGPEHLCHAGPFEDCPLRRLLPPTEEESVNELESSF